MGQSRNVIIRRAPEVNAHLSKPWRRIIVIELRIEAKWAVQRDEFILAIQNLASS